MVLVSGMPARRAKPGQVSLASVGEPWKLLPRCAPELAPSHQRLSPGIIDTPMFGDDMDRRQQMLVQPLPPSDSASRHGRRSRSGYLLDQKRLRDRHDSRCRWGLVAELRSTSPQCVRALEAPIWMSSAIPPCSAATGSSLPSSAPRQHVRDHYLGLWPASRHPAPYHNQARDRILGVRRVARELGKEVQVFTSGAVVCRPTQQEADEYFHLTGCE